MLPYIFIRGVVRVTSLQNERPRTSVCENRKKKNDSTKKNHRKKKTRIELMKEIIH
jgi:hypothetical protein